MTRVRICVGNLKGGTAKSTTAMHLTLGLARTGSVLLVDADGTNASCLDWAISAEKWPQQVKVVAWAMKDLAAKVEAVACEYDHLVVDTGPEQTELLRQALMATDELVVPVSPSPLELRKLEHTFSVAAAVDATSPVSAQVLLTKVRSRTRSSSEARAYLAELGLPVMEAQIHLREVYAMAWGTAPEDLGEYEGVLVELLESEEQA